MSYESQKYQHLAKYSMAHFVLILQPYKTSPGTVYCGHLVQWDGKSLTYCTFKSHFIEQLSLDIILDHDSFN